MAALDDLKSAVETETSVITSAVTLINGFADRIEAVKGNETAIEQEVAQMRHNAEALATAVQSNTQTGVNPPQAVDPSPNVLTFSPTSGAVGTSVQISGIADAANATDVTFNGVPASFAFDGISSLTARVPSGATDGVITVQTEPGVNPGTTQTSASTFIVTTS